MLQELSVLVAAFAADANKEWGPQCKEFVKGHFGCHPKAGTCCMKPYAYT
jgi:hypothetical protein